MSVNCFCLGFSFCPYYRSVRYSGVSARRELAVWEPYNQWFLVGFLADVIQCEVTDHLLFWENIRLN